MADSIPLAHIKNLAKASAYCDKEGSGVNLYMLKQIAIEMLRLVPIGEQEEARTIIDSMSDKT